MQVLDQIHRQPMSISLSMVSLPAPESIVDSFPVKTQGKSVRSQAEDDVTQYVFFFLFYARCEKLEDLVVVTIVLFPPSKAVIKIFICADTM